MTAIAALFNVPQTPEELNEWACAHAQHHREIIASIQTSKGVQLVQYPLDPIPVNDLGAWVYQHQQMHNQYEAILGIAGYDLTDVNLQDRGQLEGWVFLNANSHLQAANILGIG